MSKKSLCVSIKLYLISSCGTFSPHSPWCLLSSAIERDSLDWLSFMRHELLRLNTKRIAKRACSPLPPLSSSSSSPSSDKLLNFIGDFYHKVVGGEPLFTSCAHMCMHLVHRCSLQNKCSVSCTGTGDSLFYVTWGRSAGKGQPRCSESFVAR